MPKMIFSRLQPAKLNLFLKVIGRRCDGYHLIDSLFVPFPAAADEIIFTPQSSNGILQIECPHPMILCSQTNIVTKAAAKYAAITGLNPSWHFKVTKNIPVAAGMGGGSADAAAAIMLLNSHYGLLNEAQLFDLALELGADVPFFLVNRCARVGGIGEKIEILNDNVPPMFIVAVYPNFPVSARWAYLNLAAAELHSNGNDCINLFHALQAGDFNAAAKFMHNDLEYALIKKFPLITIIMEKMREFGALRPMITGSGSSIISLFQNAQTAETAVAELKNEYPDFSIFYS